MSCEADCACGRGKSTEVTKVGAIFRDLVEARNGISIGTNPLGGNSTWGDVADQFTVEAPPTARQFMMENTLFVESILCGRQFRSYSKPNHHGLYILSFQCI